MIRRAALRAGFFLAVTSRRRAAANQRMMWVEPMSIGLIGLLDDVAGIAKAAAASLDDVASQAAKAGAKAAGS